MIRKMAGMPCSAFAAVAGMAAAGMLTLGGGAVRTATAATVTVDLEAHAAPGATVYLDPATPGQRTVVRLLSDRAGGGGGLVDARVELPPGGYEARFRVAVVPVELLHTLSIELRAGDERRSIGALHIPPGGGYRDLCVPFTHGGGEASLSIAASGSSGFERMRGGIPAGAEGEGPATRLSPAHSDVGLGVRALNGLDDLDGLLAGVPSLESAQFILHDHRVLCGGIVIVRRQASPAVVRSVSVDKIHYVPGETVQAVAVLQAEQGGEYRFIARDVTEFDTARPVYSAPVSLRAGTPLAVEFSFELDDMEFGHELRCTLESGGRELHSAAAIFGVSHNVYRMGVYGHAGPLQMRGLTLESARSTMASNKENFANYFEKFAWAPCDFSDMTPETEEFVSGQGQYFGSISGVSNLITAAHEVGIKAITYAKNTMGGISGYETIRRDYRFTWWGRGGAAARNINTWFLEREAYGEYGSGACHTQGKWGHWHGIGVNSMPYVLEWGAREILRSTERFGWDGARWDWHFANEHLQKYFIDYFNREHPGFVWGYNDVSVVDFGGGPTPETPLHQLQRDNPDQPMLFMCEATKHWPSGGARLDAGYTAFARSADLTKRHGGLPLYFLGSNRGSSMDDAFNILLGLAAGQRYTANHGAVHVHFPSGISGKFLTRYAAYVWDLTQRVALPEQHITLRYATKATDGVREPFWRHTTWIRSLPQGRQQLLVHLLNRPGHDTFFERWQTPPAPITGLTLRVATPAGARLVRAMHVSPDLPHGHEPLAAVAVAGAHEVTLPELHVWSIIAIEYEAGPEPIFPVTQPGTDNPMPDPTSAPPKPEPAPEPAAEPEPVPEPEPEPEPEPKPKPRHMDVETEEKLVRPAMMRIRRNGTLNALHVRGIYSWLTPFHDAVGYLMGEVEWPMYVGQGQNLNRLTYDYLFGLDVVALDNTHANWLGAEQRVRLADYVRAGGGLLFFGGYWTLSGGVDGDTALVDLLPVTVQRFQDFARFDTPQPLTVVDEKFFGGKVHGTLPAAVLTVDTSPLKPGIRVLATVNGLPAITAHDYGDGRVVTFLINPHGDFPEHSLPYWEWAQWPRLIATCTEWAAAGWQARTEVAVQKVVARALDPGKPDPLDLDLQTLLMEDTEFIAFVMASRINVIDVARARALLQFTVDQAERIADTGVLAKLIAVTEPFMDETFAPLGNRMVKSSNSGIQLMGYQILAQTGGTAYLPELEKALRDPRRAVVRHAITGLSQTPDPRARAMLERYLDGGEFPLRAMTALMRIGYRHDYLEPAFKLYDRAVARNLELLMGLPYVRRDAASIDYWKGVLRGLEIEQVCNGEDRAFFEGSLDGLDARELQSFARAMSATQNRHLTRLAYRIFSAAPRTEAMAARRLLKEARLHGLRMLAED